MWRVSARNGSTNLLYLLTAFRIPECQWICYQLRMHRSTDLGSQRAKKFYQVVCNVSVAELEWSNFWSITTPAVLPVFLCLPSVCLRSLPFSLSAVAIIERIGDVISDPTSSRGKPRGRMIRLTSSPKKDPPKVVTNRTNNVDVWGLLLLGACRRDIGRSTVGYEAEIGIGMCGIMYRGRV